MNSIGATLSSLATLVKGQVVGASETLVVDVTHDSRAVESGSLFVAIRGFSADGHAYIDQAINSGASAVCVEDQITDCPVPQLIVDNSRSVLGLLAAEVHGRPSGRLRIVGITGTNGKTTVAHLLESIASTAGLVAGRIGTTGASIAGIPVALPRTTPEASDFQRLLAAMVADEVDIVAAEVSSHAMTLDRVVGVEFEVVAFTNLSRDHLDFHGDMDSYFAAKAKLFERAERAVINVDDPRGDELIRLTPAASLRVGVDVRASDVELATSHTRFRLMALERSEPVRLPLAGDFNVSNALVAAGCAMQLGIDIESIVAGLESVEQIPGRYELVAGGSSATVVVDYAHTPEGVAKVIATARATGVGSVIVVLGAGGDRDQSKRAEMGTAAAAADRFILTSDNPRSESPMAIIDDVRAGVPEGVVDLAVEPDRRRAIGLALAGARAADTVLVLGKGHEQGQEIAGRVLPFDDVAVVAEELAKVKGTSCSHY